MKEQPISEMENTCVTESIEMNIIGTLPQTGNLKPNWKISPSLFTCVDTPVWGSRFAFKKKIGNLSEGSVPVIFISMLKSDITTDL